MDENVWSKGGEKKLGKCKLKEGVNSMQMKRRQQRENVLMTVTLAANTLPPKGALGNAENRPKPLSCDQWEPDVDNFH